MKRLSQQPFERIQRDKPVKFSWQGSTLDAYAGDTVASALLANNTPYVARSFKYGRKRHILSAGTEEPNGLVTLEAGSGYHVPNARATETELYEGMKVSSASGVPSLKFDMRAAMKPLHRFMAAGFYYKTFMSPAKLWPHYEHQLRQLSGFSKAPDQADAEHYDHQYHHYDIAIVGGGPAGISAAIAAGQSGASVVLIEERVELGGEMIADCARDLAAGEHLKQQLEVLSTLENVRVMRRTCAYALHDFNLLLALERKQDHLPLAERNENQVRQRSHRIRAKEVILATGAHERPMLFAGNDLPRVMLAGAVSRYMHEFALLCGEHPVITGNNDSIYALGMDYLALGIKPTVIDCRKGYDASRLIEQGALVLQGHAVIEAVAEADRVSSVKVAPVHYEDGAWMIEQSSHLFHCDLVASSGGFSPLVHLDCHTGSKPTFDPELQAFMPAGDKPNRYMAGSIQGHANWQDCQAAGAYAAMQAVTSLGLEVKDSSCPTVKDLGTADFLVPKQGRDKIFLDMQNDVKASDIELAIRENYRSIEHIKRYTALGFGTDQGKTGNINGIAVAADVLGVPMTEIGTTTFRPMYTPVTMGALAGEHKDLLFDPQRFTPMQASHDAMGAEYEVVGQWMRPWYFPKGEEDMHQAVHRECLAVRNSLGMMDASTLGKIDIQGPDARELLARVYTNAWAKLAPGQCRYGLMCDENGMIIDDGVTSCISDTHFVMNTTTGGAAAIYSHLELWLQTEWPDLKVYLTSVTDHWSTTAVVGPKARRLMEKLCPDWDFDHERFPFMSFQEGEVLGVVPARIMRISFSGELSYEINVQANYGRAVWDAVYELGREWDITPYGTEAMHVLRAEKGFIIVGQDTDGSVTPYDANMAWAVSTKKPYPFLGQRALTRSDTSREGRKQLVGIRPKDPQMVLPEGCQLVNAEDDVAMIGHVTSSYMSPILGHSFAMAVVKGGLSRMGETVFAKPLSGDVIPVSICDSVFYDANKEKINGEL